MKNIIHFANPDAELPRSFTLKVGKSSLRLLRAGRCFEEHPNTPENLQDLKHLLEKLESQGAICRVEQIVD